MGKVKKIINILISNRIKFLGVFGIVCFGLMAIYSLCLATPIALYVNYYSTKSNLGNYVNSINNTFLILAIIGLLLAAAYFILRNAKRKTFYISNYIGTSLICAFSFFTAIYLFIAVAQYQQMYTSLDFEEVNAAIGTVIQDQTMSPTSPIFIIGFLLGGIIVVHAVCCAVLILSRALTGKKNGQTPLEKPDEEIVKAEK